MSGQQTIWSRLLGGAAPRKEPAFDGATFERGLDGDRLLTLLDDVLAVMRRGEWLTLAEIRAAVGRGSEAGISARLRDLRKQKFGGHVVERRRRATVPTTWGIWEYRLTR